jgi:hypothetical protein
MNDRKEQLQKAIMTNDMELVRDFYEYIFGDKPPKTLASTNKSSVAEDYRKKIRMAIHILSDEAEDLEYIDTHEVVKEKPRPAATNNSDMKFISSKDFELPEDNNPEYEKLAKSIPKRKKEKRPEYKANVVKCALCGSDFDFNKEYPVGMLESGANAKIKCNKCRAG